MQPSSHRPQSEDTAPTLPPTAIHVPTWLAPVAHALHLLSAGPCFQGAKNRVGAGAPPAGHGAELPWCLWSVWASLRAGEEQRAERLADACVHREPSCWGPGRCRAHGAAGTQGAMARALCRGTLLERLQAQPYVTGGPAGAGMLPAVDAEESWLVSHSTGAQTTGQPHPHCKSVRHAEMKGRGKQPSVWQGRAIPGLALSSAPGHQPSTTAAI